MGFKTNFSSSANAFETKFGTYNTIYDGENGATFYPNVSEDGILSWTNDKNLANPTPRKVRGEDGEDGDDGVSVTSVRQTTTSNVDGGENVITVSLSNGKDFIFVVKNGSKGSKGDVGDKGEKGDKGDRGAQGIQGIQGIQGVKGDKGEPFTIAKVYSSISSMNSGYNTDGVEIGGFVVISTGNVEDADNAKLFLKGNSRYEYITDLSGAQGMRGEKGEQGQQGIQGDKGDKGDTGLAGYTPVKGTDYWTDTDKQEIVQQTKDAIDIPTIPEKVSAFTNDAGYATTNAPQDVNSTETTTAKFKTSNGGAVIFGKEGTNSGTMIRLDQEDGTARLLFRSSKAKGAMVWEQPEPGAELYIDLGEKGNDFRRITFPTVSGTLVTATALLNLVYPVGSIYMSVNDTDPATFIGGTWKRIQDTFLLAAGSKYGAGTTGGEATHTLTVDEMPKHSHKFALADNGSTADTDKITFANSAAASTSSKKWRTTDSDMILETGGGKPYNNMPPYLAVYVWKRTA